MSMFKIKVSIPTPIFHPITSPVKVTTFHPIVSPLESDSKICLHPFTFSPSMSPPSVAPATTILCPDYFSRLPPACCLSVVIITFSNLTQIIAHLYLKCSNGFQVPLKQNSHSLTRFQSTM